jgi:hypothetical protein
MDHPKAYTSRDGPLDEAQEVPNANMIFEPKSFVVRPLPGHHQHRSDGRLQTVPAPRGHNKRGKRAAQRSNSGKKDTGSGRLGIPLVPLLLNKEVTSLQMKQRLNRMQRFEREALSEPNTAVKVENNRL